MKNSNKKLWEDILKNLPKKEPPVKSICKSSKCPQCGAFEFGLWMISGLSYFKCNHCSYRADI